MKTEEKLKELDRQIEKETDLKKRIDLRVRKIEILEKELKLK